MCEISQSILSIVNGTGNKKIVYFFIFYVSEDDKNQHNILYHQQHHLLRVHIEWEVPNYHAILIPLSLGSKIQTIYHTALSAYSSTST
jgi:hypothetical protein